MSSTYFEDRSCLMLIRRVHERRNQWHYPVRLEIFENIRRHDCLCHPTGGDRGNDIAYDVIFIALLCESLCESDLGKFGSGVIALTEATKKTRSRSRVDYSAVFLISEMGPCSSCTLDKVIVSISLYRTETVDIPYKPL